MTRLQAVVVALLLAGCSGGTGSPTAAPKPTAVSSPAAIPTGTPVPSPTAAPSKPAAAAVEVRGFVYQPQELSVSVGTTVTWENRDGTPHTVTADDRAFDSGLLQPGATFTHTFGAPGRYGYFRIPHGAPGSGQFGAVVVE